MKNPQRQPAMRQPKRKLIKGSHRDLALSLAELLASSYVLYLKTQNFHWNVTGTRFVALHELFEKQYKDLIPAIDELAERIRAMNFRSPGTFREFEALSCIKEETDSVMEDMEMIRSLYANNKTLSAEAASIEELAMALADGATADIMVRRRQAHDKAAWMLVAHLTKPEEVLPLTVS
jgi:starvation-inducible DNA-binding protein